MIRWIRWRMGYPCKAGACVRSGQFGARCICAIKGEQA